MSDETTTLNGRCIYILNLQRVLFAEMGIDRFIEKVGRAGFSSIWIKVAEGSLPDISIAGDMEKSFTEVREKLSEHGVSVWGWHVPYCKTQQDARYEANLLKRIVEDCRLDGIIMNIDPAFFKGNSKTADIYAGQLRKMLSDKSKGLAISDDDVCQMDQRFPIDAFAKHATLNAPHVFYGDSPSVEHRLLSAVKANHHLRIPFVPVGAAWIGDNGGCKSASACAERAIIFMRLVKENNFPGYSFWHWESAPSEFWEVLFKEAM